jgi:serine/threonine-protein kinase
MNECRKCGGEISGKDMACPHCGALTPLGIERHLARRKNLTTLWVIGAVLVGLITVAMFIFLRRVNGVEFNQVLQPTQEANQSITPVAITAPDITFSACSSIGETSINPVDGQVMVCVPAGDFLMGSAAGDPGAQEDEQPQHNVYLDAFWIGQTEVTNAMFTAFTQDTGYLTLAEREGWGVCYTDGGWEQIAQANWYQPQGPESTIEGYETLPVVQVAWQDAAAYCTWAGMRLPTEAEWEKAARGTQGLTYPWGNDAPSGVLLNFADQSLDVDWALDDINDGFVFTAPVGSFPAGASPYGALDMAGNVWEWTSDWYSDSYYSDSPPQNPTGPSSGEWRVIRGGAWDSVDYIRSAFRNAYDPLARFDNLGFRCVAPLP